MTPPPPRSTLFPYTTLFRSVRVVSFFWGDPSPYIAAVHVAGSLVMHTVGSAAEARQVRDSGVDILVAQGWRSEEHTSELQSHHDLVCRLLLEKKKDEIKTII